MLSNEAREALTQELPAILSIEDVRSFLGVTHLTVRRMIWDGKLDAFMTFGEWNITRVALLTYLSKNSNL